MTRAEGLPLGAFAEAAGVRFAAWSDRASRISVLLYDRQTKESAEVELTRLDSSGIFAGFVENLAPGARYDFKVDGQIAVDPYARSLPSGVHGPAQVTSPLRRAAHPKCAVDLDGAGVMYELHVGAFTPEGTFASAARRLHELSELGVTTVELMPIAAFPGTRGWGYDGVGLFAPFSGYGTADELSAFLDAAHGLGMSVILDVVYNHFGPAGNPLPAFSDAYFDAERRNAWGHAPALNQPAFRRLVLDNARYWLEEFHFDGLRLDATHELEPAGDPHILAALAKVAHACSPRAVLIAEDSRNDPKLLFDLGVDAVWSDDFHHAVHVLLTGEQDGYYAAYRGALADLARVSERGQLYEGQADAAGHARGKPIPNVPQSRFVFALQNHDQVGNRAHGERLHELCGRETFHAVSLLLLFLPATPLLFMGQEWEASTPFLYFTDHAEPLGGTITEGRRREFGHFAAFRAADKESIPNPQLESTFQRSKLNWSERSELEHRGTLELYRAALALRHHDAVLSRASELSVGLSGSLLWAIRRRDQDERLLLLNLGDARSEPEIAGRAARDAELLLTTHAAPARCEKFELPAHSASIFLLREQGG